MVVIIMARKSMTLNTIKNDLKKRFKHDIRMTKKKKNDLKCNKHHKMEEKKCKIKISY
jgi:hypothetical protein